MVAGNENAGMLCGNRKDLVDSVSCQGASGQGSPLENLASLFPATVRSDRLFIPAKSMSFFYDCESQLVAFPAYDSGKSRWINRLVCDAGSLIALFFDTAMDSGLLKILRCPVSHSCLEYASEKLVKELNQSIASGKLFNRAGQKVEEHLETGLVNEEGSLFLPIRNGIAIMVSDQAIPLDLDKSTQE